MSQTAPHIEQLDDVPVRGGIDHSLALLREGYGFSERRRREGAGPTPSERAVELRLLGQRAVFIGGPEAVRFFYDGTVFRRRDAMPRPLANTLFGRGAIHTHDGPAHRKRKAMFLDLLGPDGARDVRERADHLWAVAADRWRTDGAAVLFDEAVRVIGVAVAGWAGLPLTPQDAPRRIWDLERILDGFGGVGPRHVQARLARKRSERWVRDAVREVRSGARTPSPGSAVAVVSAFREVDGNLLDERTAAVELLNMVRPAIAVAWFVAFSGLALHEHPHWRERLAGEDGDRLEADLEAFAHEVRRLYPFAPLIGARVTRDVTWRGHHLPEGRLVLLDLHGTDHDPELWPDPDRFDPERFAGGSPDPYTFVPQGGADPASGHRCAGERMTVELLKSAVRALTRISYELPEQDLSFPLSRIPTRPRSGVLLNGVR